MSQSPHNFLDEYTNTNHPPEELASFLQHDFSALCIEPSTPALKDAHLCTICVEPSEPSLRAQIPECNHTFCLSCLLSWAKVREVCPNCKSTFTNLLVSRDLTGEIVPGPPCDDGTLPTTLESLALLQRVEWVKPREVLSPTQDFESPFNFPDAPSHPVPAARPLPYPASPAPLYLHEEFEDELESQFWEEEDQQYNRLMGHRTMSNRRFGANGYIAAGRLQATHRPPARPKKQDSGSGSASGSGTSNRNVRFQEPVQRRPQKPQTQGSGASASGGGRKKKVKKKSRAGIAAAKQKAEAEAAAAAAASIGSASDAVPGASSSASLDSTARN